MNKLPEHEELTNDVTLLGERLVVHTEVHEHARVRVTRRIVTEEVTIKVPVSREELIVEYLDDEQPGPAAQTVHGSTETVSSHVIEEMVLHREVPRVELDVRPYETAQFIVDTQRSLVRLEGEVATERLAVEE